jgi:hypothetical protein
MQRRTVHRRSGLAGGDKDAIEQRRSRTRARRSRSMRLSGQGEDRQPLRVCVAAWIKAVSSVLLVNGVFLLLGLWVAALPRAPLAGRVRHAFASGELTDRDYLGLDSRRGLHQFNDCLILQMISAPDDDVWANAVGPPYFKKSAEEIARCAALRELVQEGPNADLYPMGRYTRYWHGYNPVAAALLWVFDLRRARWTLKIGEYGALVLLGLAAGARHRGLLAVACGIAATGILFWALPYFGQSLDHAPGDILLVLGLACLLFWRERLSRRDALVPFCALYGAGVIYLEFLTGRLPVAAGLLFPMAYLVARLGPEPGNEPARSWRTAGAGLLAFASGGALTLLIKQILAEVIVGGGALRSAVEHVHHGTWPAGGQPFPRAVLTSVAGLLREGSLLTYGNGSGFAALGIAAALAWLAAGCLALRKPAGAARSDFLAFTVGLGIVCAWILAFQTHTVIHKSLMVRILIVPLSLGWGALAWQWLSPPVQGRRPRD